MVIHAATIMAPSEKLTHARLVPNRGRWCQSLAQWDISHFAIPLAFAAFAAMWKAACVHYIRLPIPDPVYFVLWGIALILLAITLTLYILRLFMWPASLKWDFMNPRLVNFFFVPVIIGSLLVIGAPPAVMHATGRTVAFYVLSMYQILLSVFLYGEWLFGSALIDVVHPVVFMQVIGYFLLSNIASTLLMVEEALALFSVGCLFWILIFVTNFQHVSSALSKRKERPTPTFFLFIAPPAQAAIALVLLSASWSPSAHKNTAGFLVVDQQAEWPIPALVALYVDLFLYMVIFRVFPAFWTQKFAIAWWAYIFPLSAAASATLGRCKSQNKLFWPIISGMLVSIATIAMIVVLLATCWGIWEGNLPKNASALAAYRQQAGLDNNLGEREGDSSIRTELETVTCS